MWLHLNKASFRLEIFPKAKDIFFVSSVWFSAGSTTLKLDLSAAEKKKFVPLCLCQEVKLPMSSVRGCLRSSIIVAQRSTRSRGAHPFSEHEILQNMKAQDDSQALSDDCFSICAKRRKSARRGRWERERARERERERERGREGGKGQTDALSVSAVPVLYATPPPLPRGHEWSKWMMDPAHTNASLLLRPSSPFTGMSEASTPTTTKTTAT